MFARSALALVALLSLTVVACSADAEPSGDGDEGPTSEAELRTGTVSEFTLNQSAGFGPPVAPGMCRMGGHWTVVFPTKKLTGNACISQHPVTVQRDLTDAELSSVKSALAAVRTTATPQACPTDAPVTSMSIKRPSSEIRYVAERSACGGSSTAVTGESIGALVTLMQSLSASAP